jgi:phospholipase/carboxylesterase
MVCAVSEIASPGYRTIRLEAGRRARMVRDGDEAHEPSVDDFANLRPAAFGQLLARPSGRGGAQGVLPGEQQLGLGEGRDGVLYVPASYQRGRPASVVLCLHGAGGTGARSIAAMRGQADRAGLLLVGPDSRAATWDILRGGFGPDVAFIDRALGLMFERCAVDAEHLAIEGFSDGASYALSLGIANGDLFTHILAFSPGFMAPPGAAGSPRIFVSHGTHDPVLPIDHCSRRLVPAIRRAGYEVRYREFDGGHGVPAAIQQEAVDWFVT